MQIVRSLQKKQLRSSTFHYFNNISQLLYKNYIYI